MNTQAATNATEGLNIKRTHPSLSNKTPRDKSIDPFTRHKTPRSETRQDVSRRKSEAWAGSRIVQQDAYRFLLARKTSDRPARKSSDTSDEMTDAIAEFYQAKAARIAAPTNAGDALDPQTACVRFARAADLVGPDDVIAATMDAGPVA